MEFYQDDEKSEKKTTTRFVEHKRTIIGHNADLIIPSFADVGALYLGAYSAACDRDFLCVYQIRAIQNCGYELKNGFPTTIAYKSIPLDDVDDAPLLDYIPEAIKFIDERRNMGENVLVHCMMGKSRSAAIVIAYLIHVHANEGEKLSVQEAYDFLKSKRSLVEPNPGFLKQLETYGDFIHQTPPSKKKEKEKKDDK